MSGCAGGVLCSVLRLLSLPPAPRQHVDRRCVPIHRHGQRNTVFLPSYIPTDSVQRYRRRLRVRTSVQLLSRMYARTPLVLAHALTCAWNAHGRVCLPCGEFPSPSLW